MKFIQPRRRTAAQKMPLEGPKHKKVREKIDRDTIAKQILAAMAKGNVYSPKELQTATNQRYWAVKVTLDQLIKSKMIERSGKGKFTKYARR